MSKPAPIEIFLLVLQLPYWQRFYLLVLVKPLGYPNKKNRFIKGKPNRIQFPGSLVIAE